MRTTIAQQLQRRDENAVCVVMGLTWTRVYNWKTQTSKSHIPHNAKLRADLRIIINASAHRDYGACSL